MKLRNSSVVVRQLDNKMAGFTSLDNEMVSGGSWIRTIRTALNMSLR